MYRANLTSLSFFLLVRGYYRKKNQPEAQTIVANQRCSDSFGSLKNQASRLPWCFGLLSEVELMLWGASWHLRLLSKPGVLTQTHFTVLKFGTDGFNKKWYLVVSTLFSW